MLNAKFIVALFGKTFVHTWRWMKRMSKGHKWNGTMMEIRNIQPFIWVIWIEQTRTTPHSCFRRSKSLQKWTLKQDEWPDGTICCRHFTLISVWITKAIGAQMSANVVFLSANYYVEKSDGFLAFKIHKNAGRKWYCQQRKSPNLGDGKTLKVCWFHQTISIGPIISNCLLKSYTQFSPLKAW